MLQFNTGYAMSLPDIAAALKVYKTTAPRDAKDVAMIECQNKPRVYINGQHGSGFWEGDDPTLCNHPKYSVNRSLIKLANIGDTADNVYKRIIPAVSISLPHHSVPPSFQATNQRKTYGSTS